MIQGKIRQDGDINKLALLAMPRRERFSIAPIGEFYMDLLTLDSWINARTNSTQANSLLCAKLQEREPKIRERVNYLAKKRGISFDEMWLQILKGQAEDLDPDEIVSVDDEQQNTPTTKSTGK